LVLEGLACVGEARMAETEQKRNENGNATSSYRAGGDEEELASKTVIVQSKRFYIDVKQNNRGRFIKIAEVGPGGRKSRLTLPMSTANEVKNHMTDFSEHYASLGPVTSTSTDPRNDTVLKSVTINKDNRRYYLDLKENKRGRFLKIAMTMALYHVKPQVVIPAQGIIEIRDGLTDLLTEYGTTDGEMYEQTPEPMSMRADNKMFYFDVGHNKRGTFMRISEVRPTVRTAVTVPQQSWSRFCDIMKEMIDKNEKMSAITTTTDKMNGDVKSSDKAAVVAVGSGDSAPQ